MERVVRLTLLGWLLAFVSAAPVKEDWDIYSFHINSTVTSRYATTVVTSRVVNRVDAPREINFQVRIPKNAFISNFRMRIEGQMYDGVVKAKEQAQQQYTEAVSRGESAGVVSSVGRTLEEFKTSVTVAALQKVTFELTYEELLKRTLGKYELQIHARPMQPVKDFKMDVYINEKPGITFVQVKGGLSTNALANAITKTHAHNQAWVHFYPTEQQQIMCDSCGPQGMNGDLVIAYDVNRDASLGDVKVSGGYFVHHFAPSGLPRIPKNVVFIIDRSGSMHGKKMHQTRLALLHILGDLAEEDYFGLVIFDSSVSSWKRELSQATSENLAAAKEFVRRIRDAGATDINAAVLEGAEMLKRQPREGSASLLILLTDGDPTSGVTNLERIQANVRKSINEKYPLYCLGFGFDVNFEFLEKMALENNGAARRIYQDSDADLQLQGFYEEVANPLLTDVIMIYVGGTNLTKTNFSQYYNGSEIVVAGQITDNNIDTFIPRVVALSKSTKMEFESEKDSRPEFTGTISDHHLQRVWAYLTVKQLLDKELQLADAEKENVKKEALELSLKYGFVTPHTSMVVTKPPGENTQVLHKPKEGERPMMSVGRTGLGPGSGGTQSRGFGGFGHAVLLSADAMDSPPDMAMDYSYDDYGGPYQAPTTTKAPRTTKVPFYHKFLLGAENQTLPLCYDVSAKHLKLLQDPDTGLSVNGKLRRSLQGGFQKIVIHYKNQHIEVNTDSITVRDGQLVGAFNWGQDHTTAGSVTLILRYNEMDVSIGDTRIVILLHQNKGEKLLWPVLRQFPSGNNTEGILVAKPAVYSILQENSITAKLRIHNMEVIAPRTPAVDYSVTSAPTLDCWSVSPELALQRELSDFLVTQL